MLLGEPLEVAAGFVTLLAAGGDVVDDFAAVFLDDQLHLRVRRGRGQNNRQQHARDTHRLKWYHLP